MTVFVHYKTETDGVSRAHPVQQPADHLLVALVRGVHERRHAVLVLYVRAQVVRGVDLSQPVEIVDEYRFEHLPRHLVGLFFGNHFSRASADEGRGTTIAGARKKKRTENRRTSTEKRKSRNRVTYPRRYPFVPRMDTNTTSRIFHGNVPCG